LAIATDGNLHALGCLATDADDGGSVKLFHGIEVCALPHGAIRPAEELPGHAH
jgi:hypothetical protein